jgi:hypothetical protein
MYGINLPPRKSENALMFISENGSPKLIISEDGSPMVT